MHVVLIEPEIPPNTGNIARLCAATCTTLHLVGRLGFRLSDRHLKRAGLDYWEYVEVLRHSSVPQFLEQITDEEVFFFSKGAERSYVEARFSGDSYLVFGCETRGLPPWILQRHGDRTWRIPMFSQRVRSLNLSSSVAIVIYEALRQQQQL